jgi:hypothetical protein
MKIMRLEGDSTAVALVAFLLVPYPLIYGANLLGWSRGVQVAFAFLGLIVLSGTKLAMIVAGRRRRRSRPRE